jgi:uncharacterized membrane protein
MQPIVDTLKTWQLHPFVDHFTVALILIAILADLAASLIPTRIWVRYMALALMILGTAGAWGSKVTGGWDAARVWDAVHGPGKVILRRHAELGDYLPWVFLALALWRIGVQFAGFIAASRPIYLLLAVIAGGAIIYQGRLGGEMVYNYGIGTALLPGASSVSTTIAPTSTPSVTAPAMGASPIPTVFVPSASATPAVLPPSAITPVPTMSVPVTPSPAPTPTPAASAAPPTAGMTPSSEPSSAASPAGSGPKNL